MKKHEVKIGMRVKVTKIVSDSEKVLGKTGTVVKMHLRGNSFGIEFDKEIVGHSCDGTCKSGHGWFVFPEALEEVIEEFEEVELKSTDRVSVSALKTGMVFVKEGKVFKKVKKECTEMTIEELEKKFGIKNLKIVK